MSASNRSRAVPLLIWGLALIILFAPVIALGVAAMAGTLAGCAIDAPTPCVVAGFDIGETLKASLDAAWAVPVTAGGLWPLSLALIATIAAHRAFEGFLGRFLMGGLLVAVALVATLIAPLIAILAIVPDGCQINEGGVGDCVLYGVAQGMSTHSAAVAPWLLFILAPAALAYAVIYLVILSIMAVVHARRS